MPIPAVVIITHSREYMKSKLHPLIIMVALFLFKVGIVDNMRNLGHSDKTNARYVASTSPGANALKPIR